MQCNLHKLEQVIEAIETQHRQAPPQPGLPPLAHIFKKKSKDELAEQAKNAAIPVVTYLDHLLHIATQNSPRREGTFRIIKLSGEVMRENHGRTSKHIKDHDFCITLDMDPLTAKDYYTPSLRNSETFIIKPNGALVSGKFSEDGKFHRQYSECYGKYEIANAIFAIVSWFETNFYIAPKTLYEAIKELEDRITGETSEPSFGWKELERKEKNTPPPPKHEHE